MLVIMVHHVTDILSLDDDGYNVSAVIVSLVQICTDRFYRTVAGLNALIEKEWIALGHPFGLNIFNCTYSSHISVCSLYPRVVAKYPHFFSEFGCLLCMTLAGLMTALSSTTCLVSRLEAVSSS